MYLFDACYTKKISWSVIIPRHDLLHEQRAGLDKNTDISDLGTIKFWDEKQQFLKDFLDGEGSQDDSDGKLNCDGNHRVTLDQSAFTA